MPSFTSMASKALGNFTSSSTRMFRGDTAGAVFVTTITRTHSVFRLIKGLEVLHIEVAKMLLIQKKFFLRGFEALIRIKEDFNRVDSQEAGAVTGTGRRQNRIGR